MSTKPSTPDGGIYETAQDMAARLGVSYNYLRWRCEFGAIPGARLGYRWEGDRLVRCWRIPSGYTMPGFGSRRDSRILQAMAA